MINQFPGAVAFVETYDTNEEASESADILSFEALREVFATIQTTETELVQTISDIEFSAETNPDAFELPDYGLDDGIDETIDQEFGRNRQQLVEPSGTVTPMFETIIEAMLFVSNHKNLPIDASQIADKLRNVSLEEVGQAIDRLNRLYRERNCPYFILVEGGYRLVLCPEFESVRSNFYGKTREAKLSQHAIDTLAVVAYRQPITAEEIQNVRQQSCSSILNQLVRRNLLSISREVLDKKNVVRYHTTSRFLELFQIQSLADIPRTDDLD